MSVLGDTPTRQQIKDYLVEKDFMNLYVSGNDVASELFLRRTDPVKIDAQVKDKPHTIRWCQFDETENEFTYQVSYFDGMGNPVTDIEFKGFLVEELGIDEANRVWPSFSPTNIPHFISTATNEWTTTFPVEPPELDIDKIIKKV